LQFHRIPFPLSRERAMPLPSDRLRGHYDCHLPTRIGSALQQAAHWIELDAEHVALTPRRTGFHLMTAGDELGADALFDPILDPQHSGARVVWVKG
jgi:hypothetical protein